MKRLSELHTSRLFRYPYDMNAVYQKIAEAADDGDGEQRMQVQRVAFKMGGEWIASSSHRPEWSHDIDIYPLEIRPIAETDQHELVKTLFLGDFENVIFDNQRNAEDAAFALYEVLGIETMIVQITTPDNKAGWTLAKKEDAPEDTQQQAAAV